MQGNDNGSDAELTLLVTGISKDGRRRYDPQSKRALAKACLQPGVSLAGMALKHGVNANLLRKWAACHQLAISTGTPSVAIPDRGDAFVPVVLGRASATQSAKHRSPASRKREPAINPPSHLRAQLPNGVTLELHYTSGDAMLVLTVIETLGRCDVSSRH